MLCHAWRLRCLYLRITLTRRSSGCIGNTLWISLAARSSGLSGPKVTEFETALERDPDPNDSILWGSGGKWGHLRLWQLFLWHSQWRSNARSLEISDDPNLSLMPCHVPAAPWEVHVTQPACGHGRWLHGPVQGRAHQGQEWGMNQYMTVGYYRTILERRSSSSNNRIVYIGYYRIL